MERHILREGTSSCPISSSGSQGVPTLAPPCKPYRQRRPNASDRLHIPLDSRFSGLCLNLTMWFSYHTVSFRLHTCSTGLPRRTAILVYLSQSHGLSKHMVSLGRNRNFHIICYITLIPYYFVRYKLDKSIWNHINVANYLYLIGNLM